MQRSPAQQRDYEWSQEWHASPFQYSEEEIQEVNKHYGWEKYRLLDRQDRQSD